METGHGHGRQQVLASNLAHGPARNRATHADRSLPKRLNLPTMPAARAATRIAQLGTQRAAQAMDTCRTQINRYAERHSAERLWLKAYLTAGLCAYRYVGRLSSATM
jgi:hypothetical protein